MPNPMPNTEPLDRPQRGPEPLSDPPADLPVKRTTGLATPKDRLTERSQWSNWTVLAMIVLCFFVIVRFRPFSARNPQRGSGVGRSLPGLKLQPLRDGLKPVTLADLTGRVVVLNFWDPSSSRSPDRLGEIARLQSEFQDHSAFKSLSVSCPEDAEDDLSVLRYHTRKVLRKTGVEPSIYADRDGVSRSAVDQVVGLGELPTTLILDRRGRIRGVWTGFRRGAEDEMRKLIAVLLAEG